MRTRVRSANGLIRALGVTGDSRAELLPDVPTFREAGYPSLNLSVWQAAVAPAATPRAQLQKLQEAMAKVNVMEETRAHLAKAEFESWNGTLDQFWAYIRAEGLAVADDVKRLKIPLQD